MKPTLNTQMLFARQFNEFYDRLEDIVRKDIKVVIYGYGKIGKTIERLMLNNITAFVDLSCTQSYVTETGIRICPVQEILTLDYDKILISVAGREDVIRQTLTQQYGIDDDDIYYIL
jgi:hypothetical protein